MGMDDFNAPNQNRLFALPPSVLLGVESQSVAQLIGAVSTVINQKKTGEKAAFSIADLHIGDGHIAGRIVDEYRAQCGEAARPVRVSGVDVHADLLTQAEAALSARDALGVMREFDVAVTPGGKLRNGLECGAGADMVLYAHAAYPGKLEKSKLPRMVDRLGDMALEKGAIVTLHNHGPADVDAIRKHVLGLPGHSVAGVLCNTQGFLEQQFQQHRELHSFSVTVPNTIELPANIDAVKAIFHGDESHLSGQDAADAAAIRETLAKLAGGEAQLRTIIQEMDDGQQAKAMHYFERRIMQAGGNDLPITVGGGQMVMAFKSLAIAQEAFAVVNEVCQQMTPPAIALPLSSTVMPEFDKADAHGAWAAKLQESGISPPHVHQAMVRDR